MATALNLAAYTNASGVDPLDLRVIILPDPPEKKVGSIILPESEQEKQKWAATKGTLVAMGENAFGDAGLKRQPRPGDRVMYAKYGGVNFKGADGEEYRIMNDEDVIGFLSDQ